MAKTAKDYAQIAQSIIELVGGKDNIAHAAHCMTRLRITPKDTSFVKIDELKKLGVIGAQMVGDQVQVIIGNEVNEVYDEFVKATGVERLAAIDENLDPELTKKKSIKEILGSILPAIVSCVFPILPALLACGMLQAFMLLLINLHIIPKDSPTVATFTWVYNVAFYFLPVLVGYAAAKRFNVKAAMGILMGAILIAPDFVALCQAGIGATIPNPGGPPTVIPGTGNAGFIFGIPIFPATYSNTILPVIMCVFVMGYIEKFCNKYFPKSLRFVFTPLVEILIMVPLGLLVLAPIGHRLSAIFATFLIGLYRAVGPVAVAALCIFYPFIVIAGLHFNLMAVAMAMGGMLGKNPLTHPAGFIFQYTQAAACLAVGLKAKNPDRRSMALSCAFSDAIPGISEPGMYGVTFKYKTPLYAAMAGSGVAGILSAILNVGSYMGGPPNLFTFPVFINPANGNMADLKGIIIACVVGFVVTFVLTWILYKDENADEIDAKG